LTVPEGEKHRAEKRDDTMPEYVEDETETTDESPEQDQQPNQRPSQPIEQQPDGTWILGRGADRWIPSKNQLGDMRWLVERDLRNELGVPPKTALNKDKIEFHKRQLALLDLAKQAPRCEHVFTDGRCCKAPRVKKGKLCYAHTLMEEKRPLELNLPPLEDANAVMLWLMDVLRGLAEGRTTEKTAGIMLYGLQLAMVNARFTTFQDTDHKEMVRKAPGDRRNRRNRTSSPRSERKALPLRAQRNREEEPSEGFTAKDAEVAKEEEQRLATVTAPGNRRNRTSSPRSEEKALPQRAQRNTEEEHNPVNPHESSAETPVSAGRDFTAENAEIARQEQPEERMALRVENSLEPQNAEGNPGVESAKSLFFGVEVGEGVADNRPVMPPAEPPRKSSQAEILVVTKDIEHYAGR
jgi:hypothetical protein